MRYAICGGVYEPDDGMVTWYLYDKEGNRYVFKGTYEECERERERLET